MELRKASFIFFIAAIQGSVEGCSLADIDLQNGSIQALDQGAYYIYTNVSTPQCHNATFGYINFCYNFSQPGSNEETVGEVFFLHADSAYQYTVDYSQGLSTDATSCHGEIHVNGDHVLCCLYRKLHIPVSFGILQGKRTHDFAVHMPSKSSWSILGRDSSQHLAQGYKTNHIAGRGNSLGKQTDVINLPLPLISFTEAGPVFHPCCPTVSPSVKTVTELEISTGTVRVWAPSVSPSPSPGHTAEPTWAPSMSPSPSPGHTAEPTWVPSVSPSPSSGPAEPMCALSVSSSPSSGHTAAITVLGIVSVLLLITSITLGVLLMTTRRRKWKEMKSFSGTLLPTAYDVLHHQPQFSGKYPDEACSCDSGGSTLSYTSLYEVIPTHRRALPTTKTSSCDKHPDSPPNSPASSQGSHTHVSNKSSSMKYNYMYGGRALILDQ